MTINYNTVYYFSQEPNKTRLSNFKVFFNSTCCWGLHGGTYIELEIFLQNILKTLLKIPGPGLCVTDTYWISNYLQNRTEHS